MTTQPPMLTLNAPIATKVVCFYRLLNCLRSLYGKPCVPDQTASIGAVCSGSTLFASILNSSVMLGNYLQRTTSTDDIFRCIFFLGALRVKAFPGSSTWVHIPTDSGIMLQLVQKSSPYMALCKIR